MSRGNDLHPASNRELIGAQLLSNAVVQNFRGRSGDASQSLLLHHLKVIAEGHSGFQNSVINLHRRESVHVHFGNGALNSPQQIAIEKSVEISRQAALDANFRRAAVPGLARSSHHFLEGKRVSVRGGGPASKPAKTAPHEADICEIDVAIHDVGDEVSYGFAPQNIRDRDERFQRRALRFGQCPSLLETHLSTAEHSVKTFP